jgi:hypothetical protein
MKEAPELVKKEGEGLYKKETPPDYYDGGATEEKATLMEQEVASRIKEDEGAIQGARQKIEDKMPETLTPTEVPTMQSYMELPAGTPAVFNSLPEIAPFITELMEKINKGKEAKGLKKMFGGLSRGLANDNLEFATLGASKIIRNRMDIYKKALEEGGPDLAWELVMALGPNNNYVGIKDGKLDYEGKYGIVSGFGGNDKE